MPSKTEMLCYCCGNEAKEMHHVVPRRKGGLDAFNTMPLCRECHDAIDRRPLYKWSGDELTAAINDVARTQWGKRLLLMMYAVQCEDASPPPSDVV